MQLNFSVPIMNKLEVLHIKMQGVNPKAKVSHCRELPRAAVSLTSTHFDSNITTPKEVVTYICTYQTVIRSKLLLYLQARLQAELSTSTNVIKLLRNATKNVCCKKREERRV